MASRYTTRATLIKTYLTTALAAGPYYVSTLISEANGTGSDKRILLVKWLGMSNDLTRGLSDPKLDVQRFTIIGIPVAATDDDADSECDEIAEDVIDAIRATSAYTVLNSAGGAPVGWKVDSSNKGVNKKGQLVVETIVSVNIEED